MFSHICKRKTHLRKAHTEQRHWKKVFFYADIFVTLQKTCPSKSDPT